MKKVAFFDEFTAHLHHCCETLPDYRTGQNTQYQIADAAVSAFGVFFTQSRSFLAYQRLLAEQTGGSNLHRLLGVAQIPSDNHMRNLLDTVAPENLYSVFTWSHDRLRTSGDLKTFRSDTGQYLIACDGTQTVSSQKIHCENCSQRTLANGHTQYAHTALLPVLVKAGENRVLPLEPEFITPQDGHKKQDCERVAVKRWLQRQAGRFERHAYTVLGDDLYACQPICTALLDAGFNFILTCKPDSHVALYEQVTFLAKNNQVNHWQVRHWNGRYAEIHTYRWVSGVPLRRGDDALFVNWCELRITHAETEKQLYQNSFITNHSVVRSRVSAIVRDGRARWKSENETNNVLKTKGYHLEHNFGHGQAHLANTLVTLNLLAFLFHTVLDFLDAHYHQLRAHLVTRRDFFNDLQTLLRYLRFDSWTQLMRFMLRALKLIPAT